MNLKIQLNNSDDGAQPYFSKVLRKDGTLDLETWTQGTGVSELENIQTTGETHE